MENYFTELLQIDVSKHVEKKGQFSYLSWPFAVQELGKVDPSATWRVERFSGLPYLSTECGVFVEVAVTCKGVTKSQLHPVLDQRNQPIKTPNAFQINTSIQRALVKAIALHGLGLYIYAGEDLPDGAEAAKVSAVKQGTGAITPTTGAWDQMDEDQQKRLQMIADCVLAEIDLKGAAAAAALLHDETEGMVAEEKIALWTRLDSKTRSAIKKANDERKAA